MPPGIPYAPRVLMGILMRGPYAVLMGKPYGKVLMGSLGRDLIRNLDLQGILMRSLCGPYAGLRRALDGPYGDSRRPIGQFCPGWCRAP